MWICLACRLKVVAMGTHWLRFLQKIGTRHILHKLKYKLKSNMYGFWIKNLFPNF